MYWIDWAPQLSIFYKEYRPVQDVGLFLTQVNPNYSSNSKNFEIYGHVPIQTAQTRGSIFYKEYRPVQDVGLFLTQVNPSYSSNCKNFDIYGHVPI